MAVVLADICASCECVCINVTAVLRLARVTHPAIRPAGKCEQQTLICWTLRCCNGSLRQLISYTAACKWQQADWFTILGCIIISQLLVTRGLAGESHRQGPAQGIVRIWMK